MMLPTMDEPTPDDINSPAADPSVSLSSIKSDRPQLSVPEVLFLLKAKATPGKAIPNELDAPPWRMPLGGQLSANTVETVNTGET